MEPAIALEEDYDTLVVSHRWPALNRALITGLHEQGRRVLGVFDPDEPHGREHLAALGVDDVIPASAAMPEFVSALRELGARASAARRAVTGLALVDAGARAAVSGTGIIVVAGPPGAGATEVAIALAHSLAARDDHAVLVDADDTRAAVTTRLALPTEPNLRTAVDAVEHGHGDLSGSLVALGSTNLRVLGGLPGADAAAHVRAIEVLGVVRALSASAHVVVDVGSSGSHGFASAVVAAADVVVGVGAGTPVGLSRLLGWIADLATDARLARVHLVVNCAPADSFRRKEIATEIARTFVPATLLFVPFDRKVDAAAWEGTAVGRGTFTTAVATLADSVCPRPIARRASRRRLARRRVLALLPGAGGRA
jgi:MinD-like ATPase involved in chromosome partitioning or flagellar assembly